MNMLQRLIGRYMPKAETTTLRSPATWFLEAMFGQRESAAGIRVSEATALGLSAYYCGVNMISGTIASLPLNVYKTDGRKREVWQNHPAHYLLHTEPNSEMSSMSLRQSWVMHALDRGNAYGEILWDSRGNPMEIWPIPPHICTPRRDDSGQLWYEIRPSNSEARYLKPEDVIHVPGLGYDGIMGYGLIQLARESIGLNTAQDQYAAKFFRNGGNISGVVETDKVMNDSQFNRLKSEIAQKLQGLTNAHRIAILENGMKFKSMNPSHADAQLVEARRFTVEEWARWLNMPPHKLKEMTHATFCLPADAQISTETGPKAIVDVKVGERVWSMDADRKMVLAAVKRSSCTGDDEILEIKTRARTLRCNARHRVLVRREVYEPFDGGSGMCVRIDGVRYRHSTKTDWMQAGEIREGDRLVSPVSLPDYGTDYAPTRKATVPFMESLGFILGDGFFVRSHHTGKGCSFGISHGENADYLPDYVSAIETSFMACDGPYGMKNGGTVALVAKRRDKNTTIFHSTLAYAELEQLGIVGTSKTKRVPKWVFGLTRELRIAFIRGYLDSDGTVNKHGQARFVSVNRVMLEQFRYLCMSCGIRVGNIFSSEIKSKFDGYAEYTHILFGFLCSDPNEIGTHTPMYRERIDKNLASGKLRVVKLYPNEAKRCVRDEDFYYQRVISIAKMKSEPVYDLEVENTHSFIADGVIVHNSNIEHQNIEWVVDTIRPWLVRFEQEFNRKLFRKQSIFYTKHVVEGLLRGDLKSRFDAYAIARNWGWMSANDILELEDRNPLPGKLGDMYLVPLNMIPAEQAGKQQTAPTSAPAAPPKDDDDDDESEAEAVARRLARATAERLVRYENRLLATASGVAYGAYIGVGEKIASWAGASPAVADEYCVQAQQLNLIAAETGISPDELTLRKTELLTDYLLRGGTKHA